MRRRRIISASVAALIFIIEVIIALFVRDRFVRPYLGDTLVVILICAFLRIFVPDRVKLLPLYVFLFAVAVEVGQYFNYVELLGLGESAFFRTLLGTSFAWGDIAAYAAGAALAALAEWVLLWRKNKTQSV